MPAKSITINLLGQEDLKHTPQGRIIGWALTYGRYIMIGTEVVVLLAFISRFSLDRKLTDLKEEIEQKQAILEANQDLETTIRTLQNRLGQIKQLTTGQHIPIDILTILESVLPYDVTLQALSVSGNQLSGQAVAGTSLSFAQLLANLQASKEFSNTEISGLKKNTVKGIEFSFSVNIQKNSKSKK